MKSKYGLIVGGSGALGTKVLSTFKKGGWKLINVDFKKHEEADANIILDGSQKTY